MAPLGQGCAADALGACSTPGARELTAQMAAALVYRVGGASPSLQPLPAQREGDKLQPTTERLMRDGADRPRVGADASPGDQLASTSRLVWGRWSTVPVPGDSLTIAFREALSGNEVLVGDGYYFLFRSPGGPNLLPALTGGFDFKLDASSAYYRTPGNDITTASVDSGNLRIDFSQRSYSTRLSLSAPGVSGVTAQFAGRIDPQTGIFLGQGAAAGQSLAGALSLGGRQAGYHFSTPVGLGSISGATLWSR